MNSSQNPDGIQKFVLGTSTFPGKCSNCGGPNPILFNVYFGTEKIEHVVSIPICKSCGSKRKWTNLALIVLLMFGLLIVIGGVFGEETLHDNSMFLAIFFVVVIGALIKSNPLDDAAQVAVKVAKSALIKRLNINSNLKQWIATDEFISIHWNEWTKWIICMNCNRISKIGLPTCPSCGKALFELTHNNGTFEIVFSQLDRSIEQPQISQDSKSIESEYVCSNCKANVVFGQHKCHSCGEILEYD